MPPVEQLENPIDKYASQVVSADGKTLGIYAHSQDNRIMVNYNDLSPDLVKALIATEDVRFAEHSGIDAQGLFRAVVDAEKWWRRQYHYAAIGKTVVFSKR